ncbi:unnamed protein product [Ambrosiozyma monospora]|uniref:Unnamed protein product n=1 Tax=Ambrosiozyma monospora TaxID=43982 RepID=A0ACB5U3T8_AMBMO|nr:unnamed protein product [Ambrosiozyma monospora]
MRNLSTFKFKRKSRLFKGDAQAVDLHLHWKSPSLHMIHDLGKYLSRSKEVFKNIYLEHETSPFKWVKLSNVSKTKVDDCFFVECFTTVKGANKTQLYQITIQRELSKDLDKKSPLISILLACMLNLQFMCSPDYLNETLKRLFGVQNEQNDNFISFKETLMIMMAKVNHGLSFKLKKFYPRTSYV